VRAVSADLVRDLIADSLRNIRAHWLRVLLTGTGIVWGIALFTALSASGAALREHYREHMEAIGRKVIYVFPGAVPRAGGASRLSRRIVLERDDPARLPPSQLIDRAEPELWLGPRVLKGGGHIKVVWTYGVGPATGQIRNFRIARGRFITADDVAARRRVLVIGAKVEERLFGRGSGLGRTVRLDGHPFRIVGVSPEKGEQMMNMGPRDDEQALVPLSTAQRLFTASERIDYVIYEPRTRAEGWASTARARALLAPHHDVSPGVEEAFSFFNIADAIRLVEDMNVAVHIFYLVCGLLTLVAGGIGVMNIMLVAVAERTRELALRKAVGATNRDLFLQLLCETVVVTLVAGALGIALGAGIIGVLAALRNSSASSRFLMPDVHFSLDTALFAAAVLFAVAIAAGITPARRAARVDPAVALRDE
jgi:putative ABC transport system permease protein